MVVIKVTQVLNDKELNEIVTLKIGHDFERLHRIFPIQVDRTEPLQVWIDEMSDDGNDLIGDPIAIAASKAQWFLREYCRRPKSEWAKVIQPN